MTSPLQAWTRALELTAPIAQQPLLTLPVLIEQLAEHYGAAPALLAEANNLSYRALAAAANRYANWALDEGLKSGDVVCLLMSNRPDYMAIWLGLSRIGLTVALLNTQLRGDGLAHALTLVAPRCLIVDAALEERFETLRGRLPASIACWSFGPSGAPLPRLDLAASTASSAAPSASRFSAPSLEQRALLIYTSGTTGLPKAANVSHLRLMQWSHWFAGLMDTRAEDRMYNCLPMYHSIGGVVAPAAMLVRGGAVVVRERFSVTRFWSDIVRERCTLFQYIGELCRYLLQAPPDPSEQAHQLRLCCGNGLREEVWRPFQQRFRIPHILEYYASTEGSFSLFNCEERVGAIGRIPGFLSHRMPVALIQLDDSTGEPIRDASGWCVRCAAGEIGEAIGELRAPGGESRSRFEGYADERAGKHKILPDVFARGDAWYRTGDLMRQDAQRFFYFVDRIGDTFRWRGENVSTHEVMAALRACPGVVDAVAYGVRVPGCEGRAGMAALVVRPDFELTALRQGLATRLPAYARPLFVRLVRELDLTGTFKLNKQELLRIGYDPALTADPLYFADAERDVFVELDAQLHERLRRGELRV